MSGIGEPILTLGPAVLLAPATSVRNVVQPTGDFVALTINGAVTQSNILVSLAHGNLTALTTNTLKISGTVPTASVSGSGSVSAVLIDITGGDSNANVSPRSLNVNLNAGYTGSRFNAAVGITNTTVGTSAFAFASNSGNIGALVTMSAAGLDNVGLYCVSANATGKNIGFYGRATGATVGINIGALGMAGSGAQNFGGYFGLSGVALVNLNVSTAAVVADAGTSGSPMILGRASGVDVFAVTGNGAVGIRTHNPTASADIVGIDSLATSFALKLKSTSAELITLAADRDFSSSSGNWSGANWAISGGAFLHTAGSTADAVLTNGAMTASQIVSGNVYKIVFTISVATAGTITPKLGTGAGTAVGKLTTYTQYVIASGNNVNLIFSPTSDFNGAIDNISVTALADLWTVNNAGGMTAGEGSNIVVGTVTGTKIATAGGAAGQKLGFFNATPIVQPLLATGAGATVDNVITVLQNLGLCRQT